MEIKTDTLFKKEIKRNRWLLVRKRKGGGGAKSMEVIL